MSDINLFSARLAKVKKRQKIKALSWQLVLGLIGVFALLMIILSGYSLIVARKNQNLASRIETAKQKVENLRSVESKQAYLSSKITAFGQLLGVQEKHQAIAEAVFALLPDGTSLKGFQVAEDGVISLSGTVPDYLTLLELIDRIKNSDQLNLPVLSAKVNSIGLGAVSGLSFSLEVLIRV